MKQLLTAGLVLGILLMISACNTIRGMGRDVASVGTGVERAASR
ncbi:MAG: entericidin EcnA/B family protein [Verrucomicrobiota bacterium]